MNTENTYKKWLDAAKNSDLFNELVFMTEPEISS